MRNHHYALGAALLIALAMPWTLAAAADLNAPIGKYKVTGNAQGETVQQLVTVSGKGPTTVNLNWR